MTMKKNLTRTALSGLLSVLCLCLAGALTGCSTDAPKMSEKDKADFKGGPMPESARAEMAKRMAEAAKQADKK